MIFDLGGGTFDVSILEISDGVFEVLATAGNNRLGGDDFDARIMNWIADTFKERRAALTCAPTRWRLQRLKEAAEKAKIELSGVASDQYQPAVHHGGCRPARSTSMQR